MKTRIHIIVQTGTENGFSFALRINKWCDDADKDKAITILSFQFTSASDGRQACNITYSTN